MGWKDVTAKIKAIEAGSTVKALSRIHVRMADSSEMQGGKGESKSCEQMLSLKPKAQTQNTTTHQCAVTNTPEHERGARRNSTIVAARNVKAPVDQQRGGGGGRIACAASENNTRRGTSTKRERRGRR